MLAEPTHTCVYTCVHTCIHTFPHTHVVLSARLSHRRVVLCGRCCHRQLLARGPQHLQLRLNLGQAVSRCTLRRSLHSRGSESQIDVRHE